MGRGAEGVRLHHPNLCYEADALLTELSHSGVPVFLYVTLTLTPLPKLIKQPVFTERFQLKCT